MSQSEEAKKSKRQKKTTTGSRLERTTKVKATKSQKQARTTVKGKALKTKKAVLKKADQTLKQQATAVQEGRPDAVLAVYSWRRKFSLRFLVFLACMAVLILAGAWAVATAPNQIELELQGDQVAVKLPANVDGGKYITSTSTIDCSSSGGHNWDSASALESRVSIPEHGYYYAVPGSIAPGVYVCVKGTTRDGTTDYYASIRRPPSTSLVPTISLQQVNTSLRVTTDPTRVIKKYYIARSNPTCSDQYSNWASTPNLTGGLITGLSHNDWVCVRADNNSNYGYAEIRIDLTAPVLTIDQVNSNLVITFGGAVTRQYFKASSSPVCSDSTNSVLWQSAAGNSQTVAMTSGQPWLCAKAVSSAGIVSYMKKQLVPVRLSVNLVQVGQNIRVDITAPTTVASKKYFSSQSSPTCDNTAAWTSANSISSTLVITGLSPPTWVCVQIVDASQDEAYDKHYLPVVRRDTSPPSLTLTQTPTQIKISSSSSDLSYYQYFRIERPTDPQTYCSSTNFRSHQNIVQNYSGQAPIDLNESDNGMYYCFKAVDTSNNASFAGLAVSVARPVIDLTQTVTQIQATSNLASATGWQYVKADRPFLCLASAFDASAQDGSTVALKASDEGHTFCFRAKNVIGDYGYQSAIIEFTNLLLSFKVENNILTAVANKPVETWQYAELTAVFTLDACKMLNAWQNAKTGNRIQLTHRLAGKYYCFKATQSSGRTGFAVLKMPAPATLISSTVIADQTEIFEAGAAGGETDGGDTAESDTDDNTPPPEPAVESSDSSPTPSKQPEETVANIGLEKGEEVVASKGLLALPLWLIILILAAVVIVPITIAHFVVKKYANKF